MFTKFDFKSEGFIYGVYTIIKKLINPIAPMGWSSTMAALVFIGGMLMLMLGLIGGFKSFDYIFALTGGGPGTSSSTLMYTIYKMAFVEMQYGKAEALAACAFVFILIISAITLGMMKRKELEA